MDTKVYWLDKDGILWMSESYVDTKGTTVTVTTKVDLAEELASNK